MIGAFALADAPATLEDWQRRFADTVIAAGAVPNLSRAIEISALITLRRQAGWFLTASWAELEDEVQAWLERCNAALPRLLAGRLVDQARAMVPAAVPAWAERFQ